MLWNKDPNWPPNRSPFLSTAPGMLCKDSGSRHSTYCTLSKTVPVTILQSRYSHPFNCDRTKDWPKAMQLLNGRSGTGYWVRSSECGCLPCMLEALDSIPSTTQIWVVWLIPITQYSADWDRGLLWLSGRPGLFRVRFYLKNQKQGWPHGSIIKMHAANGELSLSPGTYITGRK